jgi:hypothetical protein
LHVLAQRTGLTIQVLPHIEAEPVGVNTETSDPVLGGSLRLYCGYAPGSLGIPAVDNMHALENKYKFAAAIYRLLDDDLRVLPMPSSNC